MAVSGNLPVMALFVFTYARSLGVLMGTMDKWGALSLISPELGAKRSGARLNIVFALLRMRGLPPFMGFLGKLIGAQELLGGISYFIRILLVVFSGLMLVPYLRLLFSIFRQFTVCSVQIKIVRDWPL